MVVILCINKVVISQPTETKSLEAVKTPSPPVIDGNLNDSCWENAPRVTGFVDKFFDKVAADQTIAYIVYDDENIYVAFRCFESQPDKIVANETKRDGSFWNDDYVAFTIDPFHAHQFDYRSFFVVNPIGTQFSQISGGRASKTEWKGDWKATVSRSPEGWTVEMAIPFVVMNFPSTGKPVTIGINFDRKQQHTNINSFWSNVGPQDHTENDGHLVGIVFPKNSFKRRLSTMTYSSAGVQSEESNTLRAGLDAKYPITSGITAVASVNPDFSSVEQDVESIDYSYQERFYPDRRPFFQEGGDIIGNGQFGFYSRRIPQFDIGMKTYGKMGKVTIGVLDCVDFSGASAIKNDLINRNDLVLALKGDLGKSSSIPIHFIRNDNKGSWNHALILEPNYRWKNLTFGGLLGGSQTIGGKNGRTYISNVVWNNKGFYSALVGVSISKDFEITDGLVPFNNVKGEILDCGYAREWRSGIFKRANTGINMVKLDQMDGSSFLSSISTYSGASLSSDHNLGFNFDIGRFQDNQDWTLGLNLTGNASKQYKRYGVNVSYGKRENADYTFLSPYFNFRLMKNLIFGFSSQYLWHKENRNQHILSVNYDITPEKGLGSRFVYRDGKFNAFITYRQAVRKGVDAFIIAGDPNAEEMQKRVVAKVIIPI